MFGGSDADDLPSIDELIDDVTTRGEITPPDVRKQIDRQTLRIIKHDAGHRFEADGFDMKVCEDAAHAVENDGFAESLWYTSPDVVDDAREWYDERTTVETPDTGLEAAPMVANRPVRMVSEDVLPGDVMLLIGERTVVRSPVQVPTRPVGVREPAGVAVVYL